MWGPGKWQCRDEFWVVLKTVLLKDGLWAVLLLGGHGLCLGWEVEGGGRDGSDSP